MKIPPVRGKISILRKGNVMPMKLFVRCVGDLATVGGSVLVVTSFRPLPVSFFVCLRGLGISKFILLRRLTYALAELSF